MWYQKLLHAYTTSHHQDTHMLDSTRCLVAATHPPSLGKPNTASPSDSTPVTTGDWLQQLPPDPIWTSQNSQAFVKLNIGRKKPWNLRGSETHDDTVFPIHGEKYSVRREGWHAKCMWEGDANLLEGLRPCFWQGLQVSCPSLGCRYMERPLTSNSFHKEVITFS